MGKGEWPRLIPCCRLAKAAELARGISARLTKGLSIIRKLERWAAGWVKVGGAGGDGHESGDRWRRVCGGGVCIDAAEETEGVGVRDSGVQPREPYGVSSAASGCGGGVD